MTTRTRIDSSRGVGFLRGLGWVAFLVLLLHGGCVGNPPPPPGEEASSGDGEIGTSEAVSIGTSEVASTGELDETGIELGCGNGIIETGETCDATDLAGGTCGSLGFGGGTLACDDACGYEMSGWPR